MSEKVPMFKLTLDGRPEIIDPSENSIDNNFEGPQEEKKTNKGMFGGVDTQEGESGENENPAIFNLNELKKQQEAEDAAQISEVQGNIIHIEDHQTPKNPIGVSLTETGPVPGIPVDEKGENGKKFA